MILGAVVPMNKLRKTAPQNNHQGKRDKYLITSIESNSKDYPNIVDCEIENLAATVNTAKSYYLH